MDAEDEFREMSLGLWKELMDDLFPAGIPTSVQWTDLHSISHILNKLGSRPNSNHMFYPSSGGMDLEGAKPFSEEAGCLALETGKNLFDVAKPSALFFESVGPNVEWTYFRLECEPLEPCGVYEAEEGSEDGEEEGNGDGEEVHSSIQSEEVVLIAPRTYAPRSAWDADEFEGKPLPDTAQLIVRHLGGGPFVIFSKGSLYNLGQPPYRRRCTACGRRGRTAVTSCS
jgi:hypothetical protein